MKIFIFKPIFIETEIHTKLTSTWNKLNLFQPRTVVLTKHLNIHGIKQ